MPQRGTDHGTDGGDIRLQDLSDTEKRVILELIKNPENTYNQLASEMGVSRRSVSRAVASLVKKNILKESAITSSDSGKLFVDQFGVVDWSTGFLRILNRCKNGHLKQPRAPKGPELTGFR